MSRLLLDRGQVSKVLGIPAGSVAFLHRMKRLQGVRVGKFLKWRPVDIQRFIDELKPEN